MSLFMRSGAQLSEDRIFRYCLWRSWGFEGRYVNFLMLNPSTADETANDPTIERQQRRVQQWGFTELRVTNLFAFRATDPREMMRATDPIGPENDAAILDTAKGAALVICAWGRDGLYRGRSAAVREMLARAGIQARALRVSAKTGQPEHPLYIGYDVEPILYPLERAS